MILIPLDRITDNPWQTRQRYDDDYIETELAPSIARSGLLQTPTARLVNGLGIRRTEAPNLGGLDAITLTSQSLVDELLRAKPGWCVQIAFAHNRRRAFDFLATHSTPVPGVTRPGHMPLTLALLSDEDMAEHAFVENDKRKDLSPVEEALAYQRRIKDFGYSQKALAERYGKKRATISNKLRLLKLPDRVLDAVSDGRLSERAALSMVPLFTLEEPLASAARSYRRTGWVGQRPNNEWKEYIFFDVLLDEACAGALRSDAIRARVDDLLERVTEPLGLVDPEHDYNPPSTDGGAEGVASMRQGICKGCPLLVTIGEDKRCGDAVCHQEKAARAAGVILQAAHEETGLPITAEEDKEKATTFNDYSSGKKLAKRLLRKGCPTTSLHIRLAGPWSDFCVPGHDMAELVCVHIATGHCACQGDPDSNKNAQQAAAAQETRLGRARARLVGEERYARPAKEAVFQALAAKDPTAWNVALKIVRSGSGSSWSYDYSFEQGKKGFFDTDAPQSFEHLCRLLAEWACSVEEHHYGDCADSLAEVEQFARRRMEAMGLSFEEPDYGPVAIDQVAELATLSPSEETFSQLLARAGIETLQDVQRRITDEAGKPTRGHKARLVVIQSRLAALAEPAAVC